MRSRSTGGSPVADEANASAVASPFEAGYLCMKIPWYHGTMEHGAPIQVERAQTGVRLEKRLLKVLRALADLKDITLGDLIEGIVLHTFEGKAPFGPETLARIADLRRVYGLELDASACHRLSEEAPR